MNDITTYLFDFAVDHGIAIVLTDKLKPTTPSCAVPRLKKIIINNAWHNQKELPFQIAHEMAHVLNNDEGVLYYSSQVTHCKVENAANDKAVDMLMQYADEKFGLPDSYVTFMETYGIPFTRYRHVRRRYVSYCCGRR